MCCNCHRLKLLSDERANAPAKPLAATTRSQSHRTLAAGLLLTGRFLFQPTVIGGGCRESCPALATPTVATTSHIMLAQAMFVHGVDRRIAYTALSWGAV